MFNDAERRDATSASNAEADFACAGRHLAQRNLPEVAGEYADEGRIIHAALADSGDGRLAKLTLEQRETFDRCRELEKKLVSQLFPDITHNNPMRVFREQRYWCKVPPGLWEHSGRVDVVFRAGPQALIADYKTGRDEVAEASSNQQLRDLAVLVKGALLVDEVVCAVIQPFITMSPEITMYAGEDFKRAEAEMFERVRRSNDPAAKRTPGEVQCQWCRAKGKCLEYQKWAGGHLPAMLSILDVPMQSWTPEQRAIFCDRLSVAQKWLDEAKELMKLGLEKDAEYVPGWFLKPGNVQEAITDPQTCFNRFAALGGKIEQFMATVKVGKTKLRESLNQVTGARGKALDAAMDTLTDGIVAKSQNAPSLKRKEDGQ